MSRPLAPMRMPYAGRDVPHAVIEVNQRCNISCAACYKDKSTYTKPFDEIAAEVEAVARARRLAVVTLAGGEPSLHPRIVDVIRLVAARGISVQMLSNGLALSRERLREYRAAGLSRVYLHIDSLQRRPDARGVAGERDLDPLREAIGRRVVESGLRCALSVTLYRTRNFADLGRVVGFVLESPWYDRLLVTCCTDFAGIAASLARAGQAEVGPADDLASEVVSNEDVARVLEDGLGLRPYAYIASSRRRAERRWLFYYSYAVHTPGERAALLHLGPSFQRVVRAANAISRALRGRYPFGEPVPDAASVALCLAYAASSFDVRVAAETLRFLARLRARGARLVQKSLIFQQGPNLAPDGTLEICRECPDATVRNGRLVPVCLADIVAPVRDDAQAA
jgi:hypothetical protein